MPSPVSARRSVNTAARSAASSAPLWYRYGSSFSSAHCTMLSNAGGSPGRTSSSGGTGSDVICLNSTGRLVEVNGGRPVSSSYITTPSE